MPLATVEQNVDRVLPGAVDAPDSHACYFCQAWDRSLFCELDEAALTEIGSQRKRKDYPAGTHLFLEGETPRRVYCVRDGKIKLYRSLTRGRSAILGIATTGDLLGVRPLLLGRAHNLGAQALEDSTVCLLDRDSFVSLLGRHSSLSLRLAMRLSNDLREACHQPSGAPLETPTDRVRALLLSLIETHGSQTPQGIRIASGLSQEELAALAGVSRRTLSRALAELRREGFVECTRRTIVLRGHGELAGGRIA